MTYNDILRRLRFALDLSDEGVAGLMGLGGYEANAEQVHAWMGKEEAPGTVECPDKALAAFLDGLVTDRRGPRDPSKPAPVPERVLSNNGIFKKLRIALDLREPDVLEILDKGGHPLSKHELSALFRKPKHKHYRACGDQVLRAWLRGLTMRLRPDAP